MGEGTEGRAAQRLPVQLLLKIFGYLEQPTPYVLDDSRERLWVPSSFLIPQHTPQGLSEVARVCSKWLKAAKKAMYHTVLLRNPKEYENFMRTIGHDSTLPSYVKTVLYECPGYEDGPDRPRLSLRCGQQSKPSLSRHRPRSESYRTSSWSVTRQVCSQKRSSRLPPSKWPICTSAMQIVSHWSVLPPSRVI